MCGEGEKERNGGLGSGNNQYLHQLKIIVLQTLYVEITDDTF